MKVQWHVLFFIVITLLGNQVLLFAQERDRDESGKNNIDIEIKDKVKIDLSAYLDTYIATDNDELADNIRQFTIISSARKEFAINTAQLSADVSYNNMRSKITLHAGTIRESGWENFTRYPLIQEAYAGIEIADKLWIDAGYFITHIGGEALLPKDNLLSFHTVMSYYEPFYQAGIRLSYEFSEKTKADLHLLNGFGIFDDNNSQKSLAWSLTYAPKENLSFYYSGIMGNEQPSGEPHAFRHFHNVAVNYSPFKFLDTQFQVDYAVEENTKLNQNGTFSDAEFFGSFLTLKFNISDAFKLTARGELFEDADGLMGGGFNMNGLTLGAEYNPSQKSYIRLESRWLTADDEFKLFQDKEAELGTKRAELMFSFGMWID